MQGTLKEIDIRSILQLIELGQRTGELLLESYDQNLTVSSGEASVPALFPSADGWSLAKKFWFIFFVNGQIAYAADQGSNNFSRLQDYLHPYQIEVPVNLVTELASARQSIPEYACLWYLLEKNMLTPAQGRTILQGIVQETLFDLFHLHQGKFIFQLSSPLSPELTTLAIAPLIAKTVQQLQQWKQFYPLLQAPQQYFVLVDRPQLQAKLPPRVYQLLEDSALKKTSLRQLSRHVQKDALSLGKGLYPYTERGWLQFHYPIPPSPPAHPSSPLKSSPRRPHVLCIDDDVSTIKSLELLLEEQQYPFSTFTEPAVALSQIFTLQPDIIFCDIAMPQLDGYELCTMLRHSSAFAEIPLIMLTGQEGFIDRVRARMVGATDYLTKPFTAKEVVSLVEKYSPRPYYLELEETD